MKRTKYIKIVLLLSASLVIFLSTGGKAQQYKRKTPCYIGGGLENFSTGNWHGAFYSPYLNITKGRGSVNIGPVFQKRKMEFSGGKIAWSYNLSGSKQNAMPDPEDDELQGDDYVMDHGREWLQLNFFCFGQYIHNTTLSYAAQITEQKVYKGESYDWSKTRLSTAEGGLGFEIHFRITKRVTWKNYVAGAVYYHTNYIQGMYHEQVAPSLVLGTAIQICPL